MVKQEKDIPMKLLYITRLFPTPDDPISGIYNLFRVQALRQLNIQVDVLLLNSVISRDQKRINRLSNYHIKDLNYPFLKDLDISVTVKNYIKVPGLYRPYLNKLVKTYAYDHHYDIVHFHFLWDIFGDQALKQAGIPYVITCHGSDIHTLPNQSQKTKDKAIKTLSQAPHVIFVSQALHNIAKSLGYHSKHYSIIPNGIHPDLFYPDSTTNQNYRIGFIGHLAPVKRANRLPYIFEQIKKQCPNTTFHIIGDGPLKQSITTTLDAKNLLSSVTLTDKVPIDKVGQALRHIDVLLLPSIQEGWGCVVIEAQACGVSVVGSANGGIPEAIGDGGIIVPEGANFDERFADAVVKLLTHPIPKKTLLKRASQFHWDAIIKKEIAVYKTLLTH